MDSHDKAHYGIAAAFGAALLGVGSFVVGDHDKVGSIASYEWPEMTTDQSASLATSLGAMPHHDVTIYCASSCGTIPEDLNEAFTKAGWKSHVESVIASTVAGIAVSPPDDSGRAVANVIHDVLGVTPKLIEQDGPGIFTVTVGRKGR